MHSAAADSDEEKVFVKRKKRSSIFFKKKPVSYIIKNNKLCSNNMTVPILTDGLWSSVTKMQQIFFSHLFIVHFCTGSPKKKE